ncbi:hypothetical protein Aduo_004984 [Ancylostoma duodenale]
MLNDDVYTMDSDAEADDGGDQRIKKLDYQKLSCEKDAEVEMLMRQLVEKEKELEKLRLRACLMAGVESAQIPLVDASDDPEGRYELL